EPRTAREVSFISCARCASCTMSYRLSVSMRRRPPRPTLFPYTRSSDLSVLRVSLTSRPARRDPCRRASPRTWPGRPCEARRQGSDRKSTRLNSRHVETSYAVSCLKKKNGKENEKHPAYRCLQFPARIRTWVSQMAGSWGE